LSFVIADPKARVFVVPGWCSQITNDKLSLANSQWLLGTRGGVRAFLMFDCASFPELDFARAPAVSADIVTVLSHCSRVIVINFFL